MRMVTVSITYDMDDPTRPLAEEREDWIKGHVAIHDLANTGEEWKDWSVTIREHREEPTR